MKEFDFIKASDTVVKLMKDRVGIPSGTFTMYYCSTPSIEFKSGASISFNRDARQLAYKGEDVEMYELCEVFKDGKLVGHKQRKLN